MAHVKKNREPRAGWTIAVVLTYVFVINIAWIGTLIWAVIYALTHMGEWLS